MVTIVAMSVAMTTVRRTAVLLMAVTVTLLTVLACGGSVTGPSESGVGARNPDKLVFAAVPSEESGSLELKYAAIIQLLGKETGKQVELLRVTNYAAVIEGQRAGTIDIAQYGPLAYVLAKKRGADITAISAQVDKKGAIPGYQAYGITKAGSPIASLAEFAGKKVCFVDPNSTSGYLYPMAGLLRVGVRPQQDLTPIFAGGHDASVLAVASGQCDAGFSIGVMVGRLIEKGRIKPGEIATVWKSETIPGSPVAVSNDLTPELRKKITQAFQQKANVDFLQVNGFCQGKCVFDGWGYVPVQDAFYDGVRKVCDITHNKACNES
jgi:phosphonate transport system substrate-binding protein